MNLQKRVHTLFKRLNSFLKKYTPFFKAGSMTQLAFKFDMFAWLLITAMQMACVVFLWIAVYKNSAEGFESIINGYSFEEIICYFIFSNIFAFVTFDDVTLFDINEEIKDGTIAISFIKPISYRIRFASTNLGSTFTKILMIGIPFFAIAYITFFVMGYLQFVSVLHFVLFLALGFVCQITSCLLLDTINYICGVLCFYTTSGWGLNLAKSVFINFFSGVLIPLSFFPGSFGRVVELLPFAGIAQNSVLIFLGKVNFAQAGIFIAKNILWICVFEFLGWILFKHASKKVTVQGG